MAQEQGVEQVTATEAIEASQLGAWLVDVREQYEWDEAHAPAARHVPMSVVGHHLADLPQHERILVICRSGARSDRVAGALIRAGFDAVNVAGGMEAWQSAGGEVVAASGEPPRA